MRLLLKRYENRNHLSHSPQFLCMWLRLLEFDVKNTKKLCNYYPKLFCIEGVHQLYRRKFHSRQIYTNGFNLSRFGLPFRIHIIGFHDCIKRVGGSYNQLIGESQSRRLKV